jgi:quinol monooxygenase YgiN
MLMERSEISIKDGKEAEFDGVLRDKAVPTLTATPGVTSVQWGRGVENPDKFILLVVWENMDAHIAFTKGAGFQAFRDMLTAYSKGGAMEHFNLR